MTELRDGVPFSPVRAQHSENAPEHQKLCISEQPQELELAETECAKSRHCHHTTHCGLGKKLAEVGDEARERHRAREGMTHPHAAVDVVTYAHVEHAYARAQLLRHGQ